MISEYTHAIILDFEATCDDHHDQPQPQEIIEFPSVLISLQSLETVDEFQSFVRPYHHPVLTKFCKEFTSITQVDVDTANGFSAVFAKHQAWLSSYGLSEKNTIIVTCGDWDLGTILPAQCAVAVPPVEILPRIYTQWQNIKFLFCSVQDVRKASGIPLYVYHFPSGTSKWNKIEYRMFSHTTQNWRSRPLVSHEVIVNLIANTATRQGLLIQAELDTGIYPTGMQVSDNELASVNLMTANFQGDWNYIIALTRKNLASLF